MAFFEVQIIVQSCSAYKDASLYQIWRLCLFFITFSDRPAPNCVGDCTVEVALGTMDRELVLQFCDPFGQKRLFEFRVTIFLLSVVA